MQLIGFKITRDSMQQSIHIFTPAHNGLYEITRQVGIIVTESVVQILNRN
jgi:hypothetical protein